MADNPRFFVGEELEQTTLGNIEVIRDQNGDWRYADSWIKIPGGRDVTLTERFRPKLVVSADQEIERVVVDGASIRENPELLDWCLKEGKALREDGELVEVLVPYERWKRRDRIPSELTSPEHHGGEAEREVAEAERRYREAEQRLEEAANFRAAVLRRWADEMTRQEAREITGLSVGRIQQLIRDERLEDLDQPVLTLFEDGPIENMKELTRLAAEQGLSGDLSVLHSVVRDLKAGKLIEEIKGGALALTEQGERFLRYTRVQVAGSSRVGL